MNGSIGTPTERAWLSSQPAIQRPSHLPPTHHHIPRQRFQLHSILLLNGYCHMPGLACLQVTHLSRFSFVCTGNYSALITISHLFDFLHTLSLCALWLKFFSIKELLRYDLSIFHPVHA